MRPNASLRARAALWALLLGAVAIGCRDDAKPERRVLVVGWDGAGWELVDELLEQGRLPNVAALIERGFSAELDSTLIPISSAAWTSAVTGKNPAKTGVYAFFEPIDGTYDTRLVDSLSNRATPIWRTLSRRGRASVVFGVPVTYPPEPIRGTMVAGMLSPDDGAYAWPRALSDTLRARGFLPDLGMWRRDRPVLSDAVVREQLELKREIVVELLKRDDWSLGWVVFKCLDVLSHQLYDADPNGPIAAHLERLDAVLGDLVATVGPDTDVLLCSDHGFAVHRRLFDAQAWLVAEGFATPRPDAPPLERSTGPLAEAQVARDADRLARLDLATTRVLPGPCEGGFGTLRVHLAGRDPLGPVAAGDKERLLDELTTRLLALRTPEGEPLVVDVVRRADLYRGAYQERLPDLMFALAPGWLARAFPSGPPLAPLRAPTADHARVGILAGAGPRIAETSARARAGVADLAPTVLALLGETLYDDLDGAPLGAVLRLPAPPAFAPESDDPPDLPQLAREWASGLSEEERAAVEERIGALGYTR